MKSLLRILQWLSVLRKRKAFHSWSRAPFPTLHHPLQKKMPGSIFIPQIQKSCFSSCSFVPNIPSIWNIPGFFLHLHTQSHFMGILLTLRLYLFLFLNSPSMIIYKIISKSSCKVESKDVFLRWWAFGLRVKTRTELGPCVPCWNAWVPVSGLCVSWTAAVAAHIAGFAPPLVGRLEWQRGSHL